MEWVSFMHDAVELEDGHLGGLTGKTVVGSSRERETAGAAPVKSTSTALGDCVDELIEQTLRQFNGNKTQSARHLGISVRTLYNRLERMQKRQPADHE